MLLLLLVLAAPWPGSRSVFSQVYSAAANATFFDHLQIGHGGRAYLRPATPAEQRHQQHVTTDTVLVLTVDGTAGQLVYGISLRRDAHLPLAIFLATVLAAPLAWRRKGRVLAVGGPFLAALTMACLWLLVTEIFATDLPSVLPLSGAMRWFLDTAHAGLLLPPANRFAVPLMLGVGLALWQRRARS